MKFTHLKKQDPKFEQLQSKLKKAGFNCNIDKDNNKIKNFRLDLSKHEYNRNMYSGRKGAYLSYEQWEQVNNIINDHLDGLNVSCKVKSNNIFTVRGLDGRKNENDWYNDLSQLHPNQQSYILNGWS